MTLRRLLNVTVIADIVLSIGSVLIKATGVAILDPPYFNPHTDPDYDLWFGTQGMLILVYFGLLALAWIGIVRFWNPARFLYLAAWVISLWTHGNAESYEAAGWYNAFYNLIALVGGFLIALIFCSDLRHRYIAAPRDTLPQPV